MNQNSLPISLYLIPTPIGNLRDITLRSFDILHEVDTVLAEDTRTSGNLLRHYQIKCSLHPFHKYNEHREVGRLIVRMKNGEVMALMSDAGTPGISDSGFLLVSESIKNKLRVVCLPGATALIPALVQSGFPTDKFVFEGFLPHKKGRKTRLEKLATEDRTIILYESPHRLVKTLKQIAEIFGKDRYISISREMTKWYEETYRATAGEAAHFFQQNIVKGEIVIVIAGQHTKV